MESDNVEFEMEWRHSLKHLGFFRNLYFFRRKKDIFFQKWDIDQIYYSTYQTERIYFNLSAETLINDKLKSRSHDFEKCRC